MLNILFDVDVWWLGIEVLPEYQKRLHDEVDQFYKMLNGRDMTYEDCEHLPFMSRLSIYSEYNIMSKIKSLTLINKRIFYIHGSYRNYLCTSYVLHQILFHISIFKNTFPHQHL